MIRALTLSLCLSLVGVAGAQDSRPTSQPAKKKQGLPALGAPAGVYGEGVTLEQGPALKAVYTSPDDYAGKTIRLEGRIQDVCRKKGCWMVLRDGEAEVRIKFKDYGFFVPRDSSGRDVIVQGVAKAETISEEVAKHYAEEGGDPEKAKEIEGPQTVVSFVATGVEILGASALPAEAEGDAAAADALGKKLEGARPLASGDAKDHAVADAQGALARLRAVKGSRTVEFSHRARHGEQWVFGRAGDAPFSHGFAVSPDGAVVEF
ncbi:MAG: DUF4920 domain-containing protein [Planctomycetota bacterium]